MLSLHSVSANDLLLKFRCTCTLNPLMKHRKSHPTFYGNMANKARKFEQNQYGIQIHLNRTPSIIIVKSLNMVIVLLLLILTFLFAFCISFLRN